MNPTKPTTPNVDGILASHVEVLYKHQEGDELPYFGAITVSKDNREFIWDGISTHTSRLKNGMMRATLEIEVDPDMFESSYDLTRDDLISPDSATIYVDALEAESMKLFFVDGVTQEIRSIPLTPED